MLMRAGVIRHPSYCFFFTIRYFSRSNIKITRLIVGRNGGSASNPNPVNKRRDLMVIAGLVEHPEIGLVLFETGCTENVESVSSFISLQ
jgi:hypothetical protein